MAEHTCTSRSPLHGWASAFDALAPAVRLCESPVAQVVVRTTDEDAITRLDLPSACQVRRDGADDGEVAIWLGPDEWLLYRPGIPGHEYLAEVTGRLADTRPGTYLMDATGQRTRVLLAGEHAHTVLAHGCAIDLAPTSFGANEAAQTLLAQTGVILHRTGDDPESGFALLVRSSFADHLAHWLLDAAAEYCQNPAVAEDRTRTEGPGHV
ncbi:sarcosine oxidase subunit gamma [Gordonia polyisoprenivorans]|uniref:sarcosine oxidase subunit gamma n=1 Tax=Gordonia polyisoprenivorans TaxID=84595 RepID=UPI001AD6759E|nr:sarcosine oxidase subunit gamma family protein [Gordonia polyisoprenivorans]QTI69700.1 sarcosine oxidase subunit gamma [Gordonia polyisoprenivorans]